MDRRRATLLFAFVLAGCGGGGSSDSTAPPSGSVPPPVTPPPPAPAPAFAVTAFSPADGSTGAPRTVAPTVTFNAEVGSASVTPANARLLGPEGNAIACALSSVGGTLSVTPKVALPGGTHFTLELASAVSDTAGRTLVTSTRAGFDTVAQAWGAAAIEVGAMSSITAQTYPCAVALPSGNVMLVWHQGFAGADTIFASRHDARAGTWSTPAAIYSNPQAGALGPLSLAASPNDDVVLSWTVLSGGMWQAQVARHAASSDSWALWAPAESVPPYESAMGPVAVVDSQGRIALLTSTARALYAIHFDAALAQWSAPQRIDHPVTNGYLLSLRVAVDDADTIVAAWIQQDDNTFGRSVYVARYDSSARSWGTAQRAGTDAMQYMDMAIDGSGAITVVWATASTFSAGPMLWSSRCASASADWSPRVRLDADSTFGAGAPVVVGDMAGYVTAAWMQGGTPLVARYDPTSNRGWSAPVQITDTFMSGAPDIAMVADVAGNLTLTLTQSPNLPTAFRYSASEGRWLAGVVVGAVSSGVPVFANDPISVIDRAGDVTLAWYAWNRLSGVERYVVSVNRLD